MHQCTTRLLLPSPSTLLLNDATHCSSVDHDVDVASTRLLHVLDDCGRNGCELLHGHSEHDHSGCSQQHQNRADEYGAEIRVGEYGSDDGDGIPAGHHVGVHGIRARHGIRAHHDDGNPVDCGVRVDNHDDRGCGGGSDYEVLDIAQPVEQKVKCSPSN